MCLYEDGEEFEVCPDKVAVCSLYNTFFFLFIMNEITPEIMMAIQLNIIVNRTMATSIFPYTLFSVGDITGLWNLIHVNHIKINITH